VNRLSPRRGIRVARAFLAKLLHEPSVRGTLPVVESSSSRGERMFGLPPKALRQVTDTLAMVCPPWDARIMAFGTRLAVTINTSSHSRAFFDIENGQWFSMNVLLDDDGNPLDGARRVPMRIPAHMTDKVVEVVVTTQIGAYRIALTLADDDFGSFMKDAAKIALPYLTAGGR